jgi:transcriptional repressor NrdR
MNCPKCSNNDTCVLDSRETDSHKAVRRRRECAKCKHRFTTFERPEARNFLIIKKDGARESYDREKVEKGIWRACEKRKITQDQVTEVINALEEKWASLGKEVDSEKIGKGIMDALKELDEVAYIRFASVYRQFKDLETFERELKKMKG